MKMRRTIIIKTYSELIKLSSFEDRFCYLALNGNVCDITFNGHRYLNQMLYHSNTWKRVRRRVIIRDNGFDLGCDGYPINGIIIIHHINPVTIDDIIERRPIVFDLENLISTSHNTHNAIHYGDEKQILQKMVINRKKNDTCPWRE